MAAVAAEEANIVTNASIKFKEDHATELAQVTELQTTYQTRVSQVSRQMLAHQLKRAMIENSNETTQARKM